MTSTVTTRVHMRCVYSMITGVVNVGIICPLHKGQSGQANWEPVEVTIPPRTIRTYIEIAEAKETD